MTPRILKKTQPSFIVIITLGEKYRLGILTNGLIILLFSSHCISGRGVSSRVLAFCSCGDLFRFSGLLLNRDR